MNNFQRDISAIFPHRLVADSRQGKATLNDYENKVSQSVQELEEMCLSNKDELLELREKVLSKFRLIDQLVSAFLRDVNELLLFESPADAQELVTIMALDVKKTILDNALQYAMSMPVYSDSSQLGEKDDPTYTQADVSDYTPSTQQTKKKRPNLPSHAKSILSEWFQNHVDHPYPTQAEKQELSSKTGLSLQKVDNWFINERSRKWGSYRRK